MENKLKTIIEVPTEDINNNYKSFAETLKSTIDEARSEQLIQDRERKVRSANLIIHGITETRETDETSDGNQDKIFVKTFLEQIGVQGEPKVLFRLRRPNERGKRPLKLIMNDELEKQNIMSNLNKQKNAEDRFKKLSVTDDYSIGERSVGKAKAKNPGEGESSKYVWRVLWNSKKRHALGENRQVTIPLKQLNNSKKTVY